VQRPRITEPFAGSEPAGSLAVNAAPPLELPAPVLPPEFDGGGVRFVLVGTWAAIRRQPGEVRHSDRLTGEQGDGGSVISPNATRTSC
jgi:hypothetical protein